jgi:hypothetical protein
MGISPQTVKNHLVRATQHIEGFMKGKCANECVRGEGDKKIRNWIVLLGWLAVFRGKKVLLTYVNDFGAARSANRASDCIYNNLALIKYHKAAVVLVSYRGVPGWALLF